MSARGPEPPTSTRLVTLLRRPGPDGPVLADFAVEERAIPPLEPGQLLLRNIVMSVDPSMRGRLDVGEKHYTTNFEIGQPLDGSAIGVVIATESGSIEPGTVVRHRMGWRDHAVVDATAATVVDPAGGASRGLAGRARPDRVHRVGRAAADRRAARGRHRVHLGGGRRRRHRGRALRQAARRRARRRQRRRSGQGRALVDELGYDDAFDYRAESPRDGVRRVAPDGIDVYFDNVGGAIWSPRSSTCTSAAASRCAG